MLIETLETASTGVTVKYALTVSEATLAPDGTSKSMFVVNGQFPGPTLTASKFPVHIFFFFRYLKVRLHFQTGETFSRSRLRMQ